MHFCKTKISFFRITEDDGTLFRRKKLPFPVQQLQRIPLFRIMAGSDDDPAIGMLAGNRNLSRRRGSQSDVHHINPHP